MKFKGKTVWIVGMELDKKGDKSWSLFLTYNKILLSNLGASSGIGKHLATRLAKLGCRLVLTASDEERLQQVKQKCIGLRNNLLI